VILLGVFYVAWVVSDLAGGAQRVLDSIPPDRMRFLPEGDARSILAWISAGLIVLLGSVPQQDVLQRVKSARDESTAVRASIAGGVLYLFIATIPIFLVAAAALIDPAMVAAKIGEDYQLILPTLILERTPFAVQVLFFGALVSAILSTAGTTLLAPAVTVAENLVRPWAERRGTPMDDARLLRVMRLAVLAVGAAVLFMALTSKLSIYQLVNESGKVVLVSSFVPLVAALFWRRAGARGAHVSIAAGLATWIALELAAPDATVPPALAGLVASVVGMVAGTLATPRPPA
jgi:Na+/proline symporter